MYITNIVVYTIALSIYYTNEVPYVKKKTYLKRRDAYNAHRSRPRVENIRFVGHFPLYAVSAHCVFYIFFFYNRRFIVIL